MTWRLSREQEAGHDGGLVLAAGEIEQVIRES
jgi:hypothetical protein